jgi:hypothetical protein
METSGDTAMDGLPDLFDLGSGRRVGTLDEWAQRREQLKGLVQQYEYGRLPPPAPVTAVREPAREVYDGTALFIPLTLTIRQLFSRHPSDGPTFDRLPVPSAKPGFAWQAPSHGHGRNPFTRDEIQRGAEAI